MSTTHLQNSFSQTQISLFNLWHHVFHSLLTLRLIKQHPVQTPYLPNTSQVCESAPHAVILSETSVALQRLSLTRNLTVKPPKTIFLDIVKAICCIPDWFSWVSFNTEQSSELQDIKYLLETNIFSLQYSNLWQFNMTIIESSLHVLIIFQCCLYHWYCSIAYVNAGCIHTTLHRNIMNKKILAPKVIQTNIIQLLGYILKALSYFLFLFIYLVSVSAQDFNCRMPELMTECWIHCPYHHVTARYF